MPLDIQNRDPRIASATHVTWVGLVVNVVLTTFKLAAGVVGHSEAMVADGLHSLSDFVTDVVVLASFRIVEKPADRTHDYGHGKYETLAALVVGAALLAVSVGIFWGAAVEIGKSLRGVQLVAPGKIALAAAVVSIIVKEWLYRYTVRVGKHINSRAVTANAWHHRSDAFSSIGTLVGIGGAIFLGEKYRVLDPLAAAVVTFFIAKVALQISIGSIRELSEASLEDTIEADILKIASAVGGVSHPHNLRTRRIGGVIAVDLHIRVRADMPVSKAHIVASEIEKGIRDRFGQSAFVYIHVEPEDRSPSADLPPP